MSLFYGFSEFYIILLIALFPYFLIALFILFSGDISLSKEESGTQSYSIFLVISFSGSILLFREESGTHLNFKNQKVEVCPSFVGVRNLILFYLLPYSLVFSSLSSNLYPLTSVFSYFSTTCFIVSMIVPSRYSIKPQILSVNSNILGLFVIISTFSLNW